MRAISSEKDLLRAFGPQPSRGVSGALVADLGSRILRGYWNVGDVIGNEADLMHEHGVSRTTLREAIKILSGKGLLELRPRVGTKVSPHERWNFLDRDVLHWLFAGPLTTPLMRHLHEVRVIIEPGAAALAAERATDDELQRIGNCVDRMDKAGDDSLAFVAADLEFHTTILEAARNPFLTTFSGGIRTLLLAFFQATTRDPGAFESGRPRHRKLYNALAARNSKAARSAAEVVLEGAWIVISHLERVETKRSGRK
jgi:GntR family transcriptional regulator, galactonate operon transcriptional repressor